MPETLTPKPGTPRQAANIVYLSRIVLDPRSRIALRSLADPYAMHQLIYSGLPDADQGGPGNVLYRIETPKDGPPFALVQSTLEPDWIRLQHDGIALTTDSKIWDLGRAAIAVGQVLRFRLRANPTKRQSAHHSTSADGNKKDGPRVGLIREEDQREWLIRKGESAGFQPGDFRTIPLGMRWGYKTNQETPEARRRFSHFGVDFDGYLTVTDPAALREAVVQGIGTAKGFGFGLLSIMRA